MRIIEKCRKLCFNLEINYNGGSSILWDENRPRRDHVSYREYEVVLPVGTIRRIKRLLGASKDAPVVVGQMAYYDCPCGTARTISIGAVYGAEIMATKPPNIDSVYIGPMSICPVEWDRHKSDIEKNTDIILL